MNSSRPYWFLITLIMILVPVQAQEIVDLYSDIQSCDITVEGDLKGCTLDVDLISPDGLLRSKSLALNGPGTWIVTWNVPQAEEGSYQTCARLLKEGEVLSDKCFDFYYGGLSYLRFDVRDFQADQRGIRILVYSEDLAVVDIYYMLIKDNKALYVSKETSVPISSGVRAPTQLSWDWKQLLENNVEYSGRIKVVEIKDNRTRSFMNTFIARDDADITDTYEDESGASATILGKSRVPFEGYLIFNLTQNGTFIESVTKKTPVLLTDDDETVEISWKETLDPGIYHLNIVLRGNDGDLTDFEERIIEAEPRTQAFVSEEIKEPEKSSSVPIAAIVAIPIILAVVLYWMKSRRD